MSGLADAAAAYAWDGWAVFPCKPRGKIPATPHGVKDATSDVLEVERLWHEHPDANIGLATGAPSGVIAVDLDGPEGLATWRALTAEHGGHVPTRTARTGSGGWHLLYAVPNHMNIRNTAKKLGEGIDTRGTGGYIIAPPSIHPTGRRYEWVDERAPAPPPAWLLARLVTRDHPRGTPTPREDFGDADGTRYGVAALERIITELAQAQPGGRNDALNHAAYSVGRLIGAGELQPPRALDALIATGLELGLRPGEIDATIASGLRAGLERPTVKVTR